LQKSLRPFAVIVVAALKSSHRPSVRHANRFARLAAMTIEGRAAKGFAVARRVTG
jgi:hypothetical protein